MGKMTRRTNRLTSWKPRTNRTATVACGEDDRRPGDGDGVAVGGPAGPRAVQPLGRQEADPRQRVEGDRQRPLGKDEGEDVLPVRAECRGEDGDDDDDRQPSVRDKKREAEPQFVAADHRVRAPDVRSVRPDCLPTGLDEGRMARRGPRGDDGFPAAPTGLSDHPIRTCQGGQLTIPKVPSQGVPECHPRRRCDYATKVIGRRPTVPRTASRCRLRGVPGGLRGGDGGRRGSLDAGQSAGLEGQDGHVTETACGKAGAELDRGSRLRSGKVP